MKKLIIGSILFAAGTTVSFAANLGFFGGTSEDKAFNWSGTTSKQPWEFTGGATFDTTTWSDTVALWKGISGADQNRGAGYVNIDGEYTIKNFMVSGSGGCGSPMNLIFSEANNSVLNIRGSSLISLNGEFADFNFNGTGTVNVVNQSLGIKLTTDSAESKKSAVTFDSGISLNVDKAMSLEGVNSVDSAVVIKGNVDVKDYATIKNISLTYSGAGTKNIANDHGVNGDSKFTVTDNATLTVGGSFSVKDTSVGTIDSGSTLNIKGTGFTVGSVANGSSVATLNVGGNINATSAALTAIGNTVININQGAKVNIASANLEFSGQADSNYNGAGVGAVISIDGALNVTNNFTTSSYNKVTVSSSGALNVGGVLSITGNAPLANENKSVISVVISSEGNSVGGLFMAEYAGFRVNADNSWVDASVLLRGGRTTIEVANGATLELGALLSISNVSGKTTALSVEAGSKLILTSTKGSGVSGSSTFVGFGELDEAISNYLNILNFEENTICFKEIGTAEEAQNFLSHIKIDGKVNANLHFNSTGTGYWLSTAAIPEPAEWAAIFGVIALGLAIYRRRK